MKATEKPIPHSPDSGAAETLTPPSNNPNARYIRNPITTEEQRQAILALAGKRKGDPTTEEWMEEVRKYREEIRQEEIARQEGEGPEK